MVNKTADFKKKKKFEMLFKFITITFFISQPKPKRRKSMIDTDFLERRAASLRKVSIASEVISPTYPRFSKKKPILYL